MHTIENITVDIIEDSRKVPTLSVSVSTNTGFSGTCMVPSGASTGAHEAYEMRDDCTSTGGVSKAKEIILKTILPALYGKDISDQKSIDNILITLDGTENKRVLGGNSTIGVSIACAKAAANANEQEFFEYLRTLANVTSTTVTPRLFFNLINGGKHAKTKLSFQEYHLVPMVHDVSEALTISKTVQDKLGELVRESYGEVARGDEGGYALPVEDIRVPLQLLVKAVEICNLKEKVMLALDVAATSFYDKEKQVYKIGTDEYSKEALSDLYVELSKEFPLISIEDPFFEEDFSSFTDLQEKLSDVIIVGDDLTVTNLTRVKRAVDEGSIKGLIIKPNQIGTLSETIDTITFAQTHSIYCIVSHRSGETLDDMIADITVAFNCFGMKSGARGPVEREVKYARLEHILSHK